MVSTRSTKRRSRSPPATVEVERPTKSPKVVKKSAPVPKQSFEGVQLVLLDIEGTICPITFVKDTLFPYALSALPKVLATSWTSPTFAPYRDAFPAEARANPDAFSAHVADLTARDVKAAYLKNLQGYLWEDGYKSHAYSTPMYADVLDFLDRWPTSPSPPPPVPTPATFSAAADTNGANASLEQPSPDTTTPTDQAQATEQTRQRQVAIYSSGSIFAQKLLFEHIRDPSTSTSSTTNTPNPTILDKRPLITAWYDISNAGPKHSPASYSKIATDLKRQPQEILFLSDNVQEVRAALEAAMKSVVVEREGNAPLSEHDREELEVVDGFGTLSERLGI
ncbi:uncharacterized protein HMPREF1541_02392 [Cyphellophora europaea CBS 101466]|uniref:2,3-diketo-5-methylthio-1-phosphopentane phosphatase n=1 Tax=Cyphellophora europaea (strain CBS 101466) TaxID=1220924 RepID=W2S5A3_CYPE1|nr:uncharacterized protein HMPREF1541_02392 [Cyphellophora europaea CBS 101466]ETN43233.1 hypothetical protein HMPREF1541_02392 [Cyphellophora europaea CBS 101466]